MPDSSVIHFLTAPGSTAGSLLIFAPSTTATGETIGALNSLAPGAGTITTITPTSGTAPVYTLTVGGGDKSGNFSGVVGQGTGASNAVVAITKIGTGTQVFSGNNTYSAGTQINGGTLMVNGQTGSNSGTGTGAVTVNNTGTLGGNGRAAGAVSVSAGDRVQGGDGTAAGQTLSLGNNLTFASNGIIHVVAGNGGTFNDTTPTGASLVAVAGVLNRSTTTDTIQIEIALAGSGFDLSGGTTYTRRILTYGSLGANLPAGPYSGATSDFAVLAAPGAGFTTAPGWQVLVGQGGSFVDVQFTPVVPEPGAVVAVAAAGLGLAGLGRRLRRRATAGGLS